jgi:hypothetical protein
MSNNTTKQHDNDYVDEIDTYEELIPSKYRNFDDQQFEKFTKRNDWD